MEKPVLHEADVIPLDTRSATIIVRVKPQLRERIRQEARLQQVPESAVIRAILVKHYQRMGERP